MSARRDVLGRLAVLAAVGLAVAVRVGWYELLPYYDEIRPLKAGGWWELLFEAETGVNPPFYRWWMTRPADPVDGLWLGRWTATAGSAVAVAASAGIARTIGASWTAAVGAALVTALLPDAVRNGVEARAYGLAAAATALHLLTLLHLDARWGRVGAAATAAAVPWLHYSAAPWLGLTALAAVARRPRDLLLYVPAALTTLPLVLLLPGRTVEREPPREPAWAAAGHTLGLGLDVSDGEPLTIGARVVPLAVLGALALGAVGWRSLTPGARAALASALAWPLSAAVVGVVQLVRPPVFGLAAHVLVPVALGLLARSRGGGLAAGLAAAGLVGLAAPRLPDALERLQTPRVADLAGAVVVHEALDGADVVGIAPPTFLVQASFLAEGVVERLGADPARCAPWPDCVDLPGGRRLVAVPDLGGPLPPAVVVWDGARGEPATCRAVSLPEGVSLLDCPVDAP